MSTNHSLWPCRKRNGLDLRKPVFFSLFSHLLVVKVWTSLCLLTFCFFIYKMGTSRFCPLWGFVLGIKHGHGGDTDVWLVTTTFGMWTLEARSPPWSMALIGITSQLRGQDFSLAAFAHDVGSPWNAQLPFPSSVISQMHVSLKDH